MAVAVLAAATLMTGVLLLGPMPASAVPPGSIEGKVIDAVGKAGIEGVEVCAVETPEFEFEGCDETDAAGEYTIAGLPAGSYKVVFWAGGGGLNYLTQYYNGKSTFSAAEPVTVTTGAATPNIDAEMHAGGQIEGKVIDAVGKAGIENIEVCAYEAAEGEFGGCALTDAGGEYTISGLATDSYKVEFWAGHEGLNYLTQYYNAKSSFAQANAVSVTAGAAAVTHIDAEMHPGGQVKGKVVDALSGVGVAGVEVCALGATEFGGCILTASGGTYTLAGLPTNSYKIEFWAAPLGYATQYYNGKSTLAQAETVLVTAPGMVSNIDAHLGKSAGQQVPPLIPVAPDTQTPNILPGPSGASTPKALHCRKGFKKTKKHGRATCVKVKKHRKKHTRH